MLRACDRVDLVRGEAPPLLGLLGDMAVCLPPLQHPLDDVALVRCLQFENFLNLERKILKFVPKQNQATVDWNGLGDSSGDCGLRDLVNLGLDHLNKLVDSIWGVAAECQLLLNYVRIETLLVLRDRGPLVSILRQQLAQHFIMQHGGAGSE